MLYMLAYPYGDAVRLMSSYAFTNHRHGPPGVSNGSIQDPTSPVCSEGSPRACRTTPDTAPVTAEYDDDKVAPWVCEHRWQGVAGLIRFRQLIKKPGLYVHNKIKANGRAAFSIGSEGFVAMQRGWNWYTGSGNNASWNLTGVSTALQAGTYCNFADESRPLTSRPSRLRCEGEPVTIEDKGVISNGFVRSGGMVALHSEFRVDDEDAASETQANVDLMV